MADLEILQHPLSKRGHNESSFRLTTPPTTVRRKGGRQARGGWKRSSHRRRAGGRHAAEPDGQRTRGRPAGRPLVRHPAAPRLSSTRNIARALPCVFMKDTTMNGAECLLRTLLANGVDTCFLNPGTSEMQLVSALD